MGVCKSCGWWDRFCHCSDLGFGVIDHSWVSKQEWEHIDPKNPHMRFGSKAELLKECRKRGVIPKAFMKPRSASGKGVEYA